MGDQFSIRRVRWGIPGTTGQGDAVKILLLLFGIGFVVQLLFGSAVTVRLGLVPRLALGHGYVWQFATYLFLHGGLLHLLFNAYALWTFGGELEALWGFSAFLRFFLVTGVGAGLFHALITPHALVPTIGASGALMGVLAAFAMTFPDRELFFWFIPIPMRARTLVVVFAVLSLGLGAMDSPDRIAHFAHLGGIGVGVLVLKAGMWRVKWQQWARLRKTRRRLGPLRRPTDEPGQQDVDGVLDRANEVGFDRLTEREKNVLKKASRNSKRKTPKP